MIQKEMMERLENPFLYSKNERLKAARLAITMLDIMAVNDSNINCVSHKKCWRAGDITCNERCRDFVFNK